MIAIVISVLISLGVITSESDYSNLSDSEQAYYQEAIINEDLGGL